MLRDLVKVQKKSGRFVTIGWARTCSLSVSTGSQVDLASRAWSVLV
jgi:hypothetical protein